MPNFGVTELLLVLGIALLFFGPRRLKNLGTEIGGAIKGFRSAVKNDDEEERQSTNADSDSDDESNQTKSKETG